MSQAQLELGRPKAALAESLLLFFDIASVFLHRSLMRLLTRRQIRLHSDDGLWDQKLVP